MPASPAPFALALLSLGGVGRVTAHRLLERFPSPEALRQTPREQVLLRLKGAPSAGRLVATLLDGDGLDAALAAATAEADALAARGVRLLTPGGSDWPSGLDRLPRADRPVVLYAYGHATALAGPLVAVFGRPPVPAEPFEAAQRVARAAAEARAGVATGMGSGFDVAVQKVATGAGRAPVAVAASGLAALTPSLRPAATALVRGGGLLVSPFPMPHGPFAHDDRERALVQAALADAVAVASAPEGSPEARAVAWATSAGIPVVPLDADGAEAHVAALLAAARSAADR